VPTAYVLINSDLGTDESIISKIKEVLKDEKDVEFTTQGEIVNVRSKIFITTKSLNQTLNNILTSLVCAYCLRTHKF